MPLPATRLTDGSICSTDERFIHMVGTFSYEESAGNIARVRLIYTISSSWTRITPKMRRYYFLIDGKADDA